MKKQTGILKLSKTPILISIGIIALIAVLTSVFLSANGIDLRAITEPENEKGTATRIDGESSNPSAIDPTEIEINRGGSESIPVPADASGKKTLIVTLDPEEAETAKQNPTQQDKIEEVAEETIEALSETEAELNPEKLTELPIVILEGDEQTVEELEEQDTVVSVQEDKLYRASLFDSIPLTNTDDAYLEGYDGTGVAVAVLDTGVDNSHSFINVIEEACYSNANGAGSGTSLCPGGGTIETGTGAGVNCTGVSGCDHGTHVAGIAAGNGTGETFTGMAKDAGIIAMQVFTRFNSAATCDPEPAPCLLSYTSDQIKGIERVLALHNDAGFTQDIASINLSLGGDKYTSQATCDSDNSAMKTAIDSLAAVGIATVAASGNQGSGTFINAPACISTAVAVGSTTKTDAVSGFTNSNSMVDLWAPGSGIYSSIIGDENFGYKSGTSMATPHVAGAWAILKEAFPTASVSEILTALQNTGASVEDPLNGVTRSRIDTKAALDELQAGGITVNTVDSTTSEGGATATVQFELDSQPSSPVTIPLSLSDTSEGTLSGVTQIVIAAANWNIPANNEITITGVDDDFDDGDIDYTLITGDVTSSDLSYNDLGAADVANVTLTNSDNDTAGLSINATDTTTGEDGATATVQFELNAEPTANVTVVLSTDDTSEGTVPSSITITPANWDIPTNNVVTITGVDDDIIDGTIGYNLVTGDVSSSDLAFDALDASDVSDQALTNADNDTAGINVIETDLTTDEDRATAVVQFTLDSIPTSNVTIPLSLSDTSEGTLSGVTQVVITPANWNIPSNNSVTITGVDDDQIDGDVGYTLTTGDPTSSDSDYNALGAGDVANVTLTNSDNDTAGAVVSSISEVTTEAGGTATFTIELTSEPTADVTIALSSTDTTEGTVPSSITIAAANWNNPTANTVTVTGQDDVVVDGSVDYTITTGSVTSSDSNYNTLDGSTIGDVSVTNQDNDTASVLVTAPDNETTEAGATGTLRFELSSQPTADVTIALSVSDTTEGTLSSVTQIVIDDLDWNQPANNQITITGVDDDIDDGNIAFSVVTGEVTSSDSNYNALGASDVADPELTNSDDDTAGITVGTILENTDEAGGTATFQISLDSEPTENVTVALSSSDTTEGTVASSITITPTNWDQPANNIVTVTGVDDLVVDGDIDYSITTGDVSSSDSVYNAFDGGSISDVAVTNDDDDMPGVLITTTDSQSGEDTSVATVQFRLTSEPSGDVTIPLSIDDTTEGTLNGVSQIVIAVADWATPANNIVTITGVDDDIIDGDIGYNLVTGAPTSSDVDYNALTASDVADAAFTNTDNDTAGIDVTTVDSSTSENFETATVQFSLTSQPTADVTIPVSISDSTEGSIGVIVNVVITAANWDDPTSNEIVIIGENDDIADGDIQYTLVTGDPTSSDSDYNSLGASDVADITLTNFDNDVPNIIVNETFGSTDVIEGGAGDSFEIALTTEPLNDVTLTFTPDSEVDLGSGAGVATALTFTNSGGATPWDQAQVVSVDAVDDSSIEGAHTGNIQVSVSSSDSSYNAFSVEDIDVAVEDNDTAGIVVTDVDVSTDEDGATATVRYTLTAMPTASVVIPLSLDDTTEGTLSGVTSITIMPANWDQPSNNQVTITGVDDDIIDGAIGYNLITGNVTSSDSNFDALTATDVADSALTNSDNDTAGVNVTSISGDTDENGTQATFEVTLNSMPSGDVTVAFLSDDASEGTVASSITIAAANWDNGSANTVTVTGVDDDQIDGAVAYNIVTGDVTSSDSDYNALAGNSVADVAVTNQDNDSAGITVSVVDSSTDEDGGTATVQFQLTSEPSADVTIPLSINDTTEGTLGVVTQIVIAVADWDQPANNQVTITGVDDNLQDGDVSYNLITGNVTSSDSDYNALGASAVTDASLTNVDDEIALISLSIVDSTTDEDGATATVRFELGSEPTDNVTIALSVDDTTEGTAPSSITIIPANWNQPANNQITITGVNDTELDGTVAYNLITGGVTSNNSFYNALGGSDVADVALTNADNDIDTDSDLVSDEAEAVDGTDENDATDYKDSDRDKVPDVVEITEGTDKNDSSDFKDSDSGGTPDYVELYRFVAEGLAAGDENDSSDDKRDTDLDGAPDYIELCEGTDPDDSGDVLNTDSDSEIDYLDTDDDNDGILDSEEENGPNNGDANGDGIQDSKQPTVASATNDVGGGYVAFESDSGVIVDFAIMDEAEFLVDDEDTEYPLGLHDFTILGLSVGETVTVIFYYDQEYDTSDWVYKKFDPSTGEYTDISSSVTYGTANIGGNTVTTITYDITDGGALDLDGQANGVIEDPAGPSVASAANTLASTGFGLQDNFIVGAGILILIFVVWYYSKKSSKKKYEPVLVVRGR